MKNGNKNKNRIWALWAILALSFGLNTACNKKSGDGTAAPPADPYSAAGLGACANCNFPQVQLLVAQSQGSSSSPLAVNWQIIGDQNAINQNLINGTNPQTLYSGPVAARGGFSVSGNFTSGNCVIPGGQYTFQSQAGTMSYGVMNIPQIEAVNGAVRLLLGLQNAAVIDANSDGQVERIAGQLVILQGPSAYTGYPYNGTYPTNTYPVGTVPSGYTTCGGVGVFVQ